MRAYLISAMVEDPTTEATVRVSRFAGSMADARVARQTIVNDYSVMKKNVEIEDTEIPTSKDALIAFINDLL